MLTGLDRFNPIVVADDALPDEEPDQGFQGRRLGNAWCILVASPCRVRNQTNRSLTVIDLQPMGIEQLRADEAFRARTDKDPDQSPLSKPIEFDVVALIDPRLVSRQPGFNCAGRRGARSVEQLLPHDQGSGETRVDLKVERSLAEVDGEERLVQLVN